MLHSNFGDSESLGFWTLYICLVFQKLENTFQKLNLFPSTGELGESPILLGPKERANLNHWMRDKEQKFSDSECYTSSSERFRINSGDELQSYLTDSNVCDYNI
jgi:hypothetical protein